VDEIEKSLNVRQPNLKVTPEDSSETSSKLGNRSPSISRRVGRDVRARSNSLRGARKKAAFASATADSTTGVDVLVLPKLTQMAKGAPLLAVGSDTTEMKTEPLRRRKSNIKRFSQSSTKMARMILSFFQATFHSSMPSSPMFGDCKVTEYTEGKSDPKCFLNDPTIRFYAYRGTLVSIRRTNSVMHVVVRGVTHRSAFTLEEQTAPPLIGRRLSMTQGTPNTLLVCQSQLARDDALPEVLPVFAEDDRTGPTSTNTIWHGDDNEWSLEGDMPESSIEGGEMTGSVITQECRLSPEVPRGASKLESSEQVALRPEIESPLPDSPTTPLARSFHFPPHTESERRLLCHLGLFSWGDVDDFAPLTKSGKLLRELKNLDRNGAVREQHKIGVIYVADGWNTKDAILGAERASQEFDNFSMKLGTPVLLQSHRGYTGGLSTSAADSAPYYADHANEVLFHVSTWLSNGTSVVDVEVRRYRWSHIGNDEVHIVWCESDEGYSPSWLPTRFGRVSIIVYPLRTRSFRIQTIMKEPLKRWPGPLVDGAVVDSKALARLLRITVVNVSHQIRVDEGLPPHYQVRADYLDKIMAMRLVPPFEDEITTLVSPASDVKVLPSSSCVRPVADMAEVTRLDDRIAEGGDAGSHPSPAL